MLYRKACGVKQKVLTFNEEMKPIMIILRIMGVLPYSTTSTGNIN
jgi:hypothetical protein